MAFDQNYIPKELRPINVARALPDEPRIPMVSTASGAPFIATTATATSRNPEIFANPDGSIPVLYSANVSGATGFVGLANGNPPPEIGLSAPRLPVPIGIASMGVLSNPGAGFAYSPNLANMVIGNAVDHTGNDMVDRVAVSPHLGNRVNANESNESASSGFGYNPNLGSRGIGNVVNRVSDQGVDDSMSEKKIKFLCSFGGQILPRPSDGMLRYVGGQTRIISVKKDVSFNELVQKMMDTYGQPLVIKYQLPDEDLDALVSVSCPDDLDNMMDEYEKLIQRDGSAKLRVFLFSATELGATGLVHFGDINDSEQKYVDAVNGIIGNVGSAVARKDSVASATSTQNSDFSGNDALDCLGPGQVNVSGATATSMFSPSWTPAAPHDNSAKLVPTEPNPQVYADQCTVPVVIPMVKSGPPQTLSSQPDVEQDRSVPNNVPQNQLAYDFPQRGIGIPPPAPQFQTYVDPRQEITNHTDYMHAPAQMRFPNSPSLGTAGSVVSQQQIHENIAGIAAHPVIPATRMTMTPASSQVAVRPNVVQQFVQLQQNCVEHNSDENTFGTRILPLPAESSYSAYQSQFRPPIIGGGYGRHPVSQPEHVVFSDGSMPHQQVIFPETIQRLDDCLMCQKALPHAHSDPLVQNHRESGVSLLADSNSIHHRLLLGDTIKSHPLNRGMTGGNLGDGTVEQGVGARSTMFSQVDQQVESKRLEADPHISHDQLRPIGAMMETLWISAPENTANDEQIRSPIDKLRKEENLDYGNQPIAGMGVLLGTAYNKPQLVIDSNHVKHTKVLPTYNEASCVSNSQPMDSYMVTREPISGIEPAYAFDRNPSVVEWKNDTPQLQQKMCHTGKEVACAVPPSLASSVGMGDVQDSSHSLFSNQDPWNTRHDTHLPPPKPNKILIRKEAFDAKDPFSENQSSNAGELMTDGLAGGAFSQPLSNTKKDFRSEQVQLAKGSAEERIKQELQAVAENVAASVFSSASANADIMVHQRNESTYEASQDKEVSSKDVEMQQEAMLEDMKNKLPEKWNFRFPLSDGIGRLQIIRNTDLEELQELGSGTFGTVYHGKWRGTDVAIKRINDRCFAGKHSEQDRMIEDFWNEAIKLADLHHPNVLAFYGVVLDGPGDSVATVTEYMVNGSLRNALQKNERSLDKRKRLLIAMDIAFGMEYLHGKNIVHFDLKSDNLLVNLRDPHRPICKVGDLGLSKVKCQTLISGGVRGTLPWMAPELLNGSSSLVSEKVDVFSFGIVLWELLTGEEPYADLHYGAIIGGIVSNTLRPVVPDSCDPEWKLLMERCWTSEPSERPSFTEIANELRAMAAKTPLKGQQLPLSQLQVQH